MTLSSRVRSLSTERNVFRAILVGIGILAVLVASGCCSSTMRDHARRALVRAELLQAASVANPTYNEEGKIAYKDLWAAHLEHLRVLAELTDGESGGDVKGTVKVIRQLPMIPCSRCDGTGQCPCRFGHLLMWGDHPCWDCEGSGRMRQ